MSYRAAVLDLDGTVTHGERLVPGAAGGVRVLRERLERVLFLTNNPIVSPAEHAERLRGLGVEAVAEDVITSATATIAYLAAEHPGERVYPIVEAGIADQLADAGVELAEDPDAAEVVVAGFDREFDYDDMVAALRALDDPGVALVGTDPDVTIPGEDGLLPGSGAIVNAVSGVTERDPEAVLGKPSETTARLLADRLGVPPTDCLLVGDRLDTDVAMGEAVGMTTVLVRTGVTDEEKLAQSDVQPDYVLNSLSDVADVLDD